MLLTLNLADVKITVDRSEYIHYIISKSVSLYRSIVRVRLFPCQIMYELVNLVNLTGAHN